MFELVLRSPQALVEPVSDALMDELQALSVSVEDADADSDAEHALFGEPGMPAPAPGWERSTLKVLFDTESQAQAAATALLAAHGSAGVHLQALSVMADQDWVRLTQQQFQPVPITDTFWVVPSWHTAPPQARQVLRLDPGLAFGTGTHPTTRMCLRWLARQATPPQSSAVVSSAAGAFQPKAARAAPANLSRVLDYGCGSGILAIGAALLGARHIVAVDIDPAAVQATTDNARDNGVALGRAADAGRTDPDPDPDPDPVHAQLFCGLPHLATGTFHVVLANILATPLKLLAPLLSAHVAPGGWLVMAGILARQAQDIQQAYASHLHVQVADEEEGWVLMCAQRPSANTHDAEQRPGS